MPVSLPVAIGTFVAVWFTVLFAILPIGVQSQHETGEVQLGTDPGAPVKPRLLKKALWTTLVSLVVYAGIIALMVYAQ